jgi:hypothetical protein
LYSGCMYLDSGWTHVDSISSSHPLILSSHPISSPLLPSPLPSHPPPQCSTMPRMVYLVSTRVGSYITPSPPCPTESHWRNGHGRAEHRYNDGRGRKRMLLSNCFARPNECWTVRFGPRGTRSSLTPRPTAFRGSVDQHSSIPGYRHASHVSPCPPCFSLPVARCRPTRLVHVRSGLPHLYIYRT